MTCRERRFSGRRARAGLARRRTAHSVSRLARSTAVATCAVLARRPRTASPTTPRAAACVSRSRSEEHTSELQSRLHLVCRLLLEKKKHTKQNYYVTHEKIKRTPL